MSRNFSAYHVTEFLDRSIGAYLNEIEGIAIEMAHTEDSAIRYDLLNDIQEIMWQCNSVLR